MDGGPLFSETLNGFQSPASAPKTKLAKPRMIQSQWWKIRIGVLLEGEVSDKEKP